MPNPIFEHITHPSGVHELLFYEASRDAVDASVAAVDAILDARTPDDNHPVLLLSNNSLSGDEPIVYATHAYRALAARRGLEGFQNVYLALVYRSGMMMSFWVTLFDTFRLGVRMKAFPAASYVEAVAWLEDMAARAEQAGHGTHRPPNV